MKLTKGDKILIIFLIIFSIFLTYYINFSNKNNIEKYISIQVDGKEIKTIKLTKDIIGETYTVKTEFGKNVLKFGDGELKIIEASCLDQLCVKQGTISKVGELLVCLPNRLVIEIKSENTNSIIDNFAF